MAQISRDLADLSYGWQILDADPAAAARIAEAARERGQTGAEAALLLAASLRRRGKLNRARHLLAPLVRQNNAAPAAWFEWGMILCQSDESAQAVAALERAVLLAPGFAAAWRALGDLLMGLGSGATAGQAYACAARAELRDPVLAPAAAALAEGNAARAEILLAQHVRQHPADVKAHALLAEAAMRMGRLDEAESILDRCLQAAPGFYAARHSRAILFCARQKYGDAVPHLRALLDVAPHQPGLRLLLAICLEKTGDFAAANDLYEAMLQAAPNWRRVRLKHAIALKTLGREAPAAALLRRYIDQAPLESAAAWLVLADLKTVKFTAAEIDALRKLLDGGKIPPEDAAQLHYVLGHALDQKADYAAAFSHFAKGAALRRAAIHYDPNVMTRYVAQASEVFTPAFFAARTGGGIASPAPIFIVGLPRSGTTLVEQILASHKDVEGVGELEEIGAIATDLRRNRGLGELPAIIAGLDGAVLRTLGERYLARTQQYRRLGRPRFADKMPENFAYTGLIHAILPNARILDVRRAPMASGFALFRQYFRPQENGPNYSYDLAEIARYYRDYVALMDHFRAALPGVVHTVSYEALVTDTESQVRAMLLHCDLPFDPACLRFWETDRAVQTPSAQQVRRPISHHGLNHWLHYKPFLSELNF